MSDTDTVPQDFAIVPVIHYAHYHRCVCPGGEGGGHSGTEGGRTCVTYFTEEGVFY